MHLSLSFHNLADGGTSTESVDDRAAKNCCLSDEQILELGKLGVVVSQQIHFSGIIYI
jgi:hypothetical protein